MEVDSASVSGETTMEEKKPAIDDNSMLNTIARTVGTTAGIIVSRATQLSEEAAAQVTRVAKRAAGPGRKRKAAKKSAAKKKKTVVRKTGATRKKKAGTAKRMARKKARR